MNELKKTLTYVGVAAALASVALVSAPKRVTPEAFVDQGEPFFPQFTDPNAATALEVVEFDDASATAQPFKVSFANGKWTIPSHHDYPADGKEQLAKTAAGLIGLTKDDYRGDNVSDHEACGVIDPLDDKAANLKGRGKRVTVKGPNDQVFADLIIGLPVGEERATSRFVRVPDQKRVYVAKIDFEISTKFQDWIEKDLLKLERAAVDRIVLKDYSVDEQTLRVDNRDVVTLERDGTSWRADAMKDAQEVDRSRLDTLLGALDDLSIVGVRPKPAGITRDLRRAEGGLMLTQADLASLQDKGFFLAREGGLLSNEGELEASTTDGVSYTLRFGEILFGRGEAVSAGSGPTDSPESGAGENRYLFVTAALDSRLVAEPPRPESEAFRTKPEADWTDQDRAAKALSDAHAGWAERLAQAKSRVQELNDRFAAWYYVIPASSFDQMHLKRSDVVREKKS